MSISYSVFWGSNRQQEDGKYSKEYRTYLCGDKYIKQEKKQAYFPLEAHLLVRLMSS